MVIAIAPSPRRVINSNTGNNPEFNTQKIKEALQFLQDENWGKGHIYDVDVNKEGKGMAFVRYSNGTTDVRHFRMIGNGLVSYCGKSVNVGRFGNALRFS